MTDAPKEIELKLELVTDSVAVDEALDRVLACEPSTKTVDSTYFDTNGLRLQARAMALRVRTIDGQFVQTLKLGGSDGALQERGEWEVPLDGPEPELDRLDDEIVKQHIGLLFGDALLPIFRTVFQRRKYMVNWPPNRVAASRIEVVLDRGEVQSKERIAPICEIELELLEGSIQHLFDLSSTIACAVPVRPGSGSKAAVGYRLFADGTPPPVKAKPPRLDADMTVHVALQAMLREATGQWIANIPPSLDGRDPEGVHQLRVAMRRLRSLLSLFRNYVSPTGLASWQPILREQLKSLGRARQLDVFVEETLEPLARLLPDDSGLPIVSALAEAARQEAYDDLRWALHAPEVGRQMVDFLCWVELGEWRHQPSQHLPSQLGEAAALVLNKRYLKVRKQGKGFAKMPMVERHELRLNLKKLRYAVDFLGPIFDDNAKLSKALRRLQDELGIANDLAECHSVLGMLSGKIGDTAKDRSKKLALARVDGMIAGWGVSRTADQEANSAKAWKRFCEAPKFWETGL